MNLRPFDRVFGRMPHLCRPCFCFTFDNFLRKLVHDPWALLKPYVARGQTVLEVGPGKGYFTIPMAQMVGERGLVIAADIQPAMLKSVMKRARRVRMEGRIEPHLCHEESCGFTRAVDFALMFWMLHEVPDPERMLREVRAVLKPSGKLLLVEPHLHVAPDMYSRLLAAATAAGFRVEARPKIFISRAVVLV